MTPMNVEPPPPHPSDGPHQNPGADSSCRPEAPARKNRRALIFGTAALLAALATASLMRSQQSAPGDGSFEPGSMGMTPNVSIGKRSPSLILFVPDENGELKKRTVPLERSLPSGSAQEKKETLATRALQTLMEEARGDFPAGSELEGGVRIVGGVATVDFNRAFAEPNFWQGSARTIATLDAVTMTVKESKNQISGSEKDSVRFLIEGKPITELGGIDLSEPYAPGAGEEESGP